MTKPTDNWQLCPNCGSTNINGDALEIDGTEASGEVTCDTCLTEWTEIYIAAYRINIQTKE